MGAPKVNIREIDLSQNTPNFASTTGALVGYSTQGDVDNPRLISNVTQFIQEYGEPVPGEYFHYSALAFLKSGTSLYCMRAHKNAQYGGASLAETGGQNFSFVAGRATKEYAYDSAYPDALFYVFAKDPGVWNNNVGITVTSIIAASFTFVITIYEKDADGNYVEQESFTVSRKNQKDGYGRQQYLEERINGYSQYIWVADNTGTADSVLPQGSVSILALANGTNGSAVTDSELITAWDKFTNKGNYPIRLLINGGNSTVAVQGKMKDIAEARKDCFAILDIPYDQLTSATSMVSWRNLTQNFNSSYVAMYAGWVKDYDQYNDIMLSLPPSGYIASQYAFNDYVGNVWTAPAGFNRGLVSALALTNVFTDAELDTLYDAQINPIQMFSGEGFPIWGQKTEQKADSALSNVNVRRLLISIENVIGLVLRNMLFEGNTTATRFRISAILDEYLGRLSAGGAFQTEEDKGYQVVCDTTNNQAADINSGVLNVDVYVKPVRVIETIKLNIVITKSGVSFNELISRNFAL